MQILADCPAEIRKHEFCRGLCVLKQDGILLSMNHFGSRPFLSNNTLLLRVLRFWFLFHFCIYTFMVRMDSNSPGKGVSGRWRQPKSPKGAPSGSRPRSIPTSHARWLTRRCPDSRKRWRRWEISKGQSWRHFRQIW